MGQAKERKKRLGKWYGQPIGPGHPDFVPPKKPKPVRHILLFVPVDDLPKCEREIVDFVQNGELVNIGWDAATPDEVDWFKTQTTTFVGHLKIGHRWFGKVELVRCDERGCTFRRLETTKEESAAPNTTDASSDERNVQEEPKVEPQRSVRTSPDRRRIPILLLLASVMSPAATSSIPDPGSKRGF